MKVPSQQVARGFDVEGPGRARPVSCLRDHAVLEVRLQEVAGVVRDDPHPFGDEVVHRRGALQWADRRGATEERRLEEHLRDPRRAVVEHLRDRAALVGTEAAVVQEGHGGRELALCLVVGLPAEPVERVGDEPDLDPGSGDARAERARGRPAVPRITLGDHRAGQPRTDAGDAPDRGERGKRLEVPGGDQAFDGRHSAPGAPRPDVEAGGCESGGGGVEIPADRDVDEHPPAGRPRRAGILGEAGRPDHGCAAARRRGSEAQQVAVQLGGRADPGRREGGSG